VINTFETVTQVDVGVKLSITPWIHPNDFITLKVRPEVSSVSRFETTPSGSRVPVIEQSMMETEVQVKSGIYVILGGLMKKEVRKTGSGIPVLSRIPVLRYFFGSTGDKVVRTELVVMIQPKIVTGDEATEPEPNGTEDSDQK
jgi:general secretion pathway protein D